MVRTVAGLKPVGVLWRRLDAAFADPLELNQNSHIGTPGIVEALRSGSVSIVNALGAGVVGMIRGGNDPRRSNALMRYRVLFQMAAIGVFAIVLWLMKP